jgi:hypothetical protein
MVAECNEDISGDQLCENGTVVQCFRDCLQNGGLKRHPHMAD